MKRVFVSFSKARDFAINLNLKGKRQWAKYCRKNKPLKIPSDAYSHYRITGEWTNWNDFLGLSYDKRRHFVNDYYFKMWSPNMAYILGLWFADGHIYPKNNIFGLVLEKSDAYLLSKILREMDSSYPVRYYDNYAVFAIRSKAIISDIIKLGGTERKSLTCKFPNIPEEYLRHFIRGLWDGDGCAYVNKLTGICRASIASGSKEFIEKLHNVLQKRFDNLGGSITKHRGTNCYSLSFSKNDAITLRMFLYGKDTDLKLLRKFLKFKAMGEKKLLQKKDMMSFSEARGMARSYRIKNSSDWQKFWGKNKRPLNLPISPDKSYKNQGWVSWSDFLGAN